MICPAHDFHEVCINQQNVRRKVSIGLEWRSWTHGKEKITRGIKEEQFQLTHNIRI